MKILSSSFIFFSSLLFAFLAFGFKAPHYEGPITDQVSLFSKNEKRRIEEQLKQFKKDSGPSLQILILSSLEGENLEEYSIRVAEAWKIGDKKEDDEVLFVMAFKERKIRIEVGQGLEGLLPDALAGRIIQQEMIPYFKKSLYKQGLLNGLQSVAKALGGQLKTLSFIKETGKNKDQGRLFASLFFLFLLLLFFISSFLNPKSSQASLFHLLLLSLLLGGGRRGGGGFSGGGGFGGGGGFSGGGASGSW